jgi:hypothetical protein
MKTAVHSRKKLATGCSVFTALISLSVTAVEAASDAWEMRATGQAVVGSYGGSDLRDSLYAAGIFIGGDYLEQGGFTLGYNYTEVEGKADNPGDFDTLEENTFYLGGRIHSYPDSLGGKLTWRLDGYLIKDEADVKGGNGQEGSLWADGDIGVVNPIVGFINNEKTLAYDLGYAYSNYDYDGFDDYQAHQLTPTIGFAVGGSANWVQLRGYFIHLSEDDINDGNSDTAALEAKWTHWFSPGGLLGLHSVGVNALVGERFLAVDPDAAVVYTLADEQQGAIALNGSWKLGDQTSLMLQVGYEQYENRALNDDYDSAYIYLNLSHGW